MLFPDHLQHLPITSDSHSPFSSPNFQDTGPCGSPPTALSSLQSLLLVAPHGPNLLMLVFPRVQPLDLCSFSATLILLRNLIQSHGFKWHLSSEDLQGASSAQHTPLNSRPIYFSVFLRFTLRISKRCLNFPCQKLNSWSNHRNLSYSHSLSQSCNPILPSPNHWSYSYFLSFSYTSHSNPWLQNTSNATTSFLSC